MKFLFRVLVALAVEWLCWELAPTRRKWYRVTVQWRGEGKLPKTTATRYVREDK